MTIKTHARREIGRGSEASSAIGEAVDERLRRSPYLALRAIRFTLRDGVLTLWGGLPTYYLKQLAQALVIEIEGIRAVVNLIEVTSPDRLAITACPSSSGDQLRS